MKNITLAIGSDHRGFLLKNFLLQQGHFENYTITWIDYGCTSLERTDYPIYAKKVCEAIISQTADLGILLCGNGVGMTIAANRYKKIYAALVWNSLIAVTSKEDDNSNIICMPSDYITEHEACTIIHAWLNASFKQGRYLERLKLID
ncbi:MAG: RpiB/LacA/LacB family sugar-phosphate isomerase [Candidatus Babeliaceae bacterium]|jgi:ribose 5-phosphate isomerase B